MALLPSGPVRGTDNSAWLRGRRLNGKCIKLRRVRGRARKEKMESRPTRTPFDPLLIRSKAPKKKNTIGWNLLCLNYGDTWSIEMARIVTMLASRLGYLQNAERLWSLVFRVNQVPFRVVITGKRTWNLIFSHFPNPNHQTSESFDTLHSAFGVLHNLYPCR